MASPHDPAELRNLLWDALGRRHPLGELRRLHRDHGTRLVEAGVALVNDLTRRDHRQALRAAGLLLRSLPQTAPGSLQARLLRAQAHALRAGGYPKEALKRYRKAFLLLRRAGDRYQAAITAIGMVDALAQAGRTREALETGRWALRILRRRGDEIRWARLQTNLGSVLHQMGREREALRRYAAASAVFRKAADSQGLAIVRVNMANILTNQYRFREAERLYAETIRTFRELGWELLASQMEYNLAHFLSLRGRPVEALRLLERLEPKMAGLGDERHRIRVRLERAGLYHDLFLPEDALAALEGLAPACRRLGLSLEEAWGLSLEGLSLLDLGDPRGGEPLLRRAEARFLAEGRQHWVGRLRLERALQLVGDPLTWRKGAWRRAGRLVEGIGAGTLPHLAAEALLLEGSAHAMEGRLPDARRVLRRARRLAASWGVPRAELAAWRLEARLRRREGRVREARRAYEKSFGAFLRMRAALPGERFGWGQERTGSALLRETVEFLLEAGLEEELVSVYETSQGLREHLLAGSAWGARQQRLGPAARRELEALTVRLTLLQRTLWEGRGDAARIRREIAEVERRLARLLEASRELAEVAERSRKPLRRDEAHLSLVVLRGRVVAFLEREGGAVVVRHWRWPARRLQEAVEAFYRAVHWMASTPREEGVAGAIAGSMERALRELWEGTLGPLAAQLPRRVWVTPDPLLQGIPFGQLLGPEGYEVERREWIMAPARSVVRHGARPIPWDRGVAFGIPDPRAPQVEAEMQLLQRRLGHVRIGPQATVSAFLEEASRAAWVHWAGHGIFRPLNPVFTSLSFADGLLPLHRMLESGIRPRLLVLSGCSTGAVARRRGEGWMGLQRALLASGIRSLVASLWNVDDAATAELMGAFLEGLARGRSVPSALTQAQLGMLRRGAHPYAWGGFFVAGEAVRLARIPS
jgi:tetratricopeptide (TPR) repeat protein